jgi:hypothetical protein
MKKFVLASLLSTGIVSSALAADFSGTYACHLNDHSDGPFDATLTLTLVKEASFPKTGYASYDIKFDVKDMPYPYVGVAAARGNDLGLYFEATGENKDPNDRGVGIASVIVKQTDEGKEVTTINKFYYEQAYKGKANYGFEECTKLP